MLTARVRLTSGLFTSRDALVRHNRTVHGAQAEDNQSRATGSNRRKRVRAACQSCRRQKQRCDGCNPCGRCLLRNSVCDFSTPSKESAVSQKLMGLSVPEGGEANSTSLLEGCNIDPLSGTHALAVEWANVAPPLTQSRSACHTESTKCQKISETAGLSSSMLFASSLFKLTAFLQSPGKMNSLSITRSSYRIRGCEALWTYLGLR